MIAGRSTVVLAALIAAGCTRSMFVPPAGPGTPMSGAAEAWAEAVARCRGAASYSATLKLSGRAGDQSIPTLTVEAAVTAGQAIFLSATAAGRSIFVLAGEGGRASLWLRREHRVVTDEPGAIVEAIAGVRIDPDRLLAVLTGCATRNFEVTAASRHGGLVRILTRDAAVYLEERQGVWQTRAADAGGLVVEYSRDASTLPARIWLWSAAAAAPSARLEIRLVEGEINGQVPPQVFALPAGASTAGPMTLDELRARGAWRHETKVE